MDRGRHADKSVQPSDNMQLAGRAEVVRVFTLFTSHRQDVVSPRKNRVRKWHSIVQRGGIGRPLVSKCSEQRPSQAILCSLGTHTAKEDVFTSLNVTVAGVGSAHLSAGVEPEYTFANRLGSSVIS